MDYLPALGAGMIVAFAAVMLRLFFKLMAREHRRIVAHRPHHVPHFKWLHDRPRRPAPVWRHRELIAH
jgi:hypothetical protein